MNLANRELGIARRNGSSIAVIIFDLDHFKKINDNYGHCTGDRVLVEITREIDILTKSLGNFSDDTGERSFVLSVPTQTVLRR